MRNAKRAAAAVTVVVVLVFGAVAASASAEAFHYSKTGTFKGKALNLQVFKVGHASLECVRANIYGSLTEFNFSELPLSVQYEKCSLLGWGSATVSAASYRFVLPPSVRSEDALEVKASGLPGEHCSFTIDAYTSLGGNPGELAYENKSGKLVIKSKLTGIGYEVTESTEPVFCGTVGEKGTTGTFKGNDEVEMEGGTIEVW